MPVVTAIERKPRQRRARVHLDSGAVMPVTMEVLARFHLRDGSHITDSTLDELRVAEARHRALASALRLLTYRPRSEAEMRAALARRGVPHPIADETIIRLRDLSLMDDEQFARDWVDTRNRVSPRGRRLIASELAEKGVARRAIERTTAGIDEADAAYRAAARRARSLSDAPYRDFRRRLGDHLLRRGFDPDTITDTICRLWEELGGENTEDLEE